MKVDLRKILSLFIGTCLYMDVLCQEQPHVLRVGDKAPPIIVSKWIKGEPVTTFQKGHVYVAEFGATWCQPCAAAIPQLSLLASKYHDKVTIMEFFVMENTRSSGRDDSTYVGKVERYVQNQGKKMTYSAAVDDLERSMENNWLRAAGKNEIPSTFVIDGEGKIAWIGVGTANLEATLEKVVQGNYVAEAENILNAVSELTSFPYDETKLLLIGGNGGHESDFLYRSLLTRDQGNIKAGHHLFVQSYRWAGKGSREEKFQGKVQEISAPISHLYYMAYSDTVWNFPNSSSSEFYTSYGKYWFEPVLEVSNPEPFRWSHRSPQNKFHYSLKVPLEKASAKFLQRIMQRDLENYFGYEASVETRRMPCWKIKTTKSSAKNLKASRTGQIFTEKYFTPEKGFSFTNGKIKDLIFILWGYTMNQKGMPIIDATGIDHEIDLEISANILNLEEFRKALKEKGLSLEKSHKKLKVVVIRDPEKN